jgi:hypothetical protein
VRLFENAGICVSATIPRAELTPQALEGLNFEVIVIDEASDEGIGQLTRVFLESASDVFQTKIVAIGLDHLITLTYQKEVVNGAGVQDLIARTRQASALAAPALVSAE